MEMDYLIKLIETVSRSELSKFEYEEGGVKVQMEKPEAVQVMQVAPVLAGSAVQAEETAAGILSYLSELLQLSVWEAI